MACTSWQSAYALFVEFSHVFNHVNITALVTCVARRAPTRVACTEECEELDMVVRELAEFAEAEVHKCGPRELANLLYGFAKLGHCERRLAQLILARASPHAFKPQELANVFWALATCSFMPDTEWLSQAVDAAGRSSKDMRAQEVANLCWALGRLRLADHAPLLTSLAQRCAQLAGSCCATDVCQVLWAAATLEYAIPQSLLAQLLPVLLRRDRELSGLQYATVTWALAAQGAQIDKQWLASFVSSAYRKLPRFECRHVAMMLSALARRRIRPPCAFTERAVRLFAARAADAGPQDTANVLWALATWRRRPPRDVLAAILRRTSLALPRHGPQELANTLWALATLRYLPPPDLVQQICVQLVANAHRLRMQHVGNALWALARLRCTSGSRWLEALLVSFVAATNANPEPPQDSQRLFGRERNPHAQGDSETKPRSRTRRTLKLTALHALEAVGASQQGTPDPRDVLRAQHVANVVWALPRLCRADLHGGWLRARGAELECLRDLSLAFLPVCSARELVQLVCGFADLGYHPGARWLNLHREAVEKLGARVKWFEHKPLKLAYAVLDPHSVCDVE